MSEDKMQMVKRLKKEEREKNLKLIKEFNQFELLADDELRTIARTIECFKGNFQEEKDV